MNPVKIIGALAILWWLAGLAVTCALVYAGFHFISKYW